MFLRNYSYNPVKIKSHPIKLFSCGEGAERAAKGKMPNGD